MAKFMTGAQIEKLEQRYWDRKINKVSIPSGKMVVGKCKSTAKATGKHVHIKTVCDIKRKK